MLITTALLKWNKPEIDSKKIKLQSFNLGIKMPNYWP